MTPSWLNTSSSSTERHVMVKPVALLDANVFPPMWLLDILLTLDERNIIDAVWSYRILDEVRRTLVERQRRDPAKAQRFLNTIRTMNPPRIASTVGSRANPRSTCPTRMTGMCSPPRWSPMPTTSSPTISRISLLRSSPHTLSRPFTPTNSSAPCLTAMEMACSPSWRKSSPARTTRRAPCAKSSPISRHYD